MKEPRIISRLLAVTIIALSLSLAASAQEGPFRAPGMSCTPGAPYLHCPDRECSGATVINQGNVVEMKTRRTYFLDYPCDLKRGEKVTFILSLHGGGSYGNWQRHYFPLLDYKGHTEGLEPKVTEELIKLMLSAPGGKLQQIATTSAATQEKR